MYSPFYSFIRDFFYQISSLSFAIVYLRCFFPKLNMSVFVLMPVYLHSLMGKYAEFFQSFSTEFFPLGSHVSRKYSILVILLLRTCIVYLEMIVQTLWVGQTYKTKSVFKMNTDFMLR